MRDALNNLMVRCCEDIVATYEKFDYLPTYFELRFCGDPSFKFVDRCIYMKHKPHLRAGLVLSLLVKPLLFWQRFTDRHLSRRLNLEAPWCFSFHTFFNDVFVLEALLTMMDEHAGLVDDALFNRAYRVCTRILERMVENLEPYSTNGKEVEVINFFPPRDHRMNPKSWIYKKITRWKIDADFDCTYGNLAAFDIFLRVTAAHRAGRIAEVPEELLARIRKVAENSAFLDLVREFQALPGGAHSASITINHLGAENGGIMTWIGTNPNDVDPTVNVNVLTAILKNRERWNLFQRKDILDSMQHTLKMLEEITRTGLFRSERTHIYYLPVVFCNKFGRFYHEFRRLSESQQKAFDPEERVNVMRERIESALVEWAAKARLSKLDIAYVTGALLEIGYRGPAFETLIPSLAPEPHNGERDGLNHLYRPYEFFKQKVPFKFIYGSEVTSAGFVLRAFMRMASSASAGELTDEAAAAVERL